MRKLLFLVFGLSGFLIAQEKQGMVGAKFLSVELSATGTGTGAYSAIANDPSSLFWNPAGIANLTGKALFFGYTSWWVDSKFGAFAYSQPAGDYGKLGVFGGGLLSDGFEEWTVDETGFQNTGRVFSYKGFQFGVSYGTYITTKFAFGISLKGLYEGFGPFTSAYGFAVDAGTFFHTGFQTLRVAAVMQNLGPDLQPSGTYDRYELQQDTLGRMVREYTPYPIPTLFRLGAAMEVIELDPYKVTLGIEVQDPNDNDARAALGTEISLYSLVLRAGWTINQDEGGFSTGLGVVFPYVSVNYAFSDQGALPDAHRVGLSFSF